MNPQSIKTINWDPGALDHDKNMYALPDPIEGSTRFPEVRTNAIRHLEALVRAMVGAHMPTQLISLMTQGPILIRDPVLVEKFVVVVCAMLKTTAPQHSMHG